MIRSLLLLPLLLATGLVLADHLPEDGRAARAWETQVQADEGANDATRTASGGSVSETGVETEEDAKEAPETGSDAGASETTAETEEDEDDTAEAGSDTGAGEAKKTTKKGAKLISGMSILGNQEAPKSLVIVPWKSSELGNSLGISPMLDDSRQPVDKEVFMRALTYYQIRSQRKP